MSNEAEKVIRKLRAILSADVKGYSLLMSEDEASTVRTLKAYRALMSEQIEQHNGRVVDDPGDNILAEFASVVDAVQCAVEIQKVLKEKNENLPEDKRLEFRIGVNIGDVIHDQDRLYGEGVNIAARIEGLAKPGGVCISRNAYDHVKNKLTLGYEYVGEHAVKNIKDPVKVYNILMAEEDAGKLIGDRPKPLVKNWIWATIVLFTVIIAILGTLLFLNFSKPKFEPASVEQMTYPLPEKPSIAVLPFDNLSGDPGQDYLADGITENIITALSNIPEMFVIARNSVYTYKGKPTKTQKVAEDLGIRYVLEGSIQKENNRIRITGQLIDAITGHHLWADKYDRKLDDLFAIQDEITLQIVSSLQVKLTDGEQARLRRKSTKSLKAWELAVRGYSYWHRYTKEDNAKARELFERAIEEDPEYAWAWTMIGFTYFIDTRYDWNMSREESFKKMVDFANQSVLLDDSDPDVHILLAHIHLWKKEYDKAIEEGEKSLSLGPNSAENHANLGMIYRFSGRFEDSIRMTEKAIRLHPYYPDWYLYSLEYSYYYLGEHEKAINYAKKHIKLIEDQGGADTFWQNLILAQNFIRIGQEKLARYHASEAIKQNPEYNFEWERESSLYQDPELIEQQIDDLRKAGLTDKVKESDKINTKEHEKPSIAVLPFVNMSSDPEQDFFADGMTDELLTNLSKISGLLVISRNSSFVYKGKTVPIKQVANDLKVKYVLEGSIQRVGNRVRIRAQLIDGTTDHHIWAESYDAIMEDIFDLQDKITKNIASVLAVKLTTKEQNRLAAKETANIEAYDAFVKGWEHLLRETPDELEQAISLFEEAIELDPMYSRAQAALAWAYLSSSLRFLWQDFIEHHDRLRLMARKHLELAMRNPTSTAHLVASKMALFRRKYEESIAHAELVLAYDTNDPESNLNMALVLMATGKPEEGLEFVNKTLQLDPRNMGAPLAAAGMAYFILGDLQKAATMTERAIDHNPTIASRYESLSAIYALLGRIQDAQVARDESLKAWDFGRFPADLTTIMSSFLVKDRQVADRYADGLIKAGWLGSPSGYYKIYEENRLTGEEIRNLVLGKEITIHEFDRIYWINHNIKGRAMDISRVREGKWWVEDDMLCYQMESGTVRGLNDCGEIYRNPDSLPGSVKQYLNVKDYSIAALTVKE